MSGKIVFKCNGFGECAMVFTRSEHLARHVRKHTGERPFQCHCGRAFSRLDNVRQHAGTVHAESVALNAATMAALVLLHNSLSASTAAQQMESGMVIGEKKATPKARRVSPPSASGSRSRSPPSVVAHEVGRGSFSASSGGGPTSPRGSRGGGMVNQDQMAHNHQLAQQQQQQQHNLQQHQHQQQQQSFALPYQYASSHVQHYSDNNLPNNYFANPPPLPQSSATGPVYGNSLPPRTGSPSNPTPNLARRNSRPSVLAPAHLQQTGRFSPYPSPLQYNAESTQSPGGGPTSSSTPLQSHLQYLPQQSHQLHPHQTSQQQFHQQQQAHYQQQQQQQQQHQLHQQAQAQAHAQAQAQAQANSASSRGLTLPPISQILPFPPRLGSATPSGEDEVGYYAGGPGGANPDSQTRANGRISTTSDSSVNGNSAVGAPLVNGAAANGSNNLHPRSVSGGSGNGSNGFVPGGPGARVNGGAPQSGSGNGQEYSYGSSSYDLVGLGGYGRNGTEGTPSLSNSSSFSQAEVENQGRHSFLPPPPGGSQNLLSSSAYLKPAYPLPPPAHQSSYPLGFPSFPSSYASHDSKSIMTQAGHPPRSASQGRPTSASSFSNPSTNPHLPIDPALSKQQAIPRLFSPNPNLSNARPASREYNKPPITSSWPSVFDPSLRGVGEGVEEDKRGLLKRRGSDGLPPEGTLQPGEGGREWKRVLTRA